MRKLLLLVSFLCVSMFGYSQLGVTLQETFETAPYKVSCSTQVDLPCWSLNSTYYDASAGGTHSYWVKQPGIPSRLIDLNVNEFTTVGKYAVYLNFSHMSFLGVSDRAGLRIKIIADGVTTYADTVSARYFGKGKMFRSQTDNKLGFALDSYNDWKTGTFDGSKYVPNNTLWKQERFDISTFASNKTKVEIVFEVFDGNSNAAVLTNVYPGVWLDNIVVETGACEMLEPKLTAMGTNAIGAQEIKAGPFTAIGTPLTLLRFTASDASGIDNVMLEYKVDDESVITETMTRVNDTTFTYRVPFYGFGRKVTYRAVATDASCYPGHNKTLSSWNTYWYYYSGTDPISYPTGRLDSILSPPGNVIKSDAPLIVKLTNDGQPTLTSITCSWSVNGVQSERKKITLSPGLASGASTNITLTDPFVLNPKDNKILIWIDSVNGQGDINTKGDTIGKTVYKCNDLTGNIILGDVYKTFDEFFTAVRTCSLIGPTTLLVPSGTYDSVKISLANLTGITATNNLTIKPQTTGGKVIIKSFGEYAFQLSNTSNITFKDLIFVDSLSAAPRIFELTGATSNIGIENCTFYGKKRTTASTPLANETSIYAITATLKNIRIKGNTFIDGGRIVSMTGTANVKLDSIIMENNTATNVHSFVNLLYAKNVNISGNRVSSIKITHSIAMITISTAAGVTVVGNKVLNMENTSIPLFSIGTLYDSLGRNLIANNIGLLQGSVANAAITYTGSKGTDIVYNYFNSTDTATAAHYVATFSGTSSDTRFYNNIISNEGRSVLINKAATSNIDMAYNAYYSKIAGTGNVFYGGTTNYRTLDAWKAVGFDSNSVALSGKPYTYDSILNLQYQEPLRDRAFALATVPRDYKNVTRLALPTIGAIEITPITNDIAGISIDAPVDSCGMTSTETIKITMKNMGTSAIATDQVTAKVFLFKNGAWQAAGTETVKSSLISKKTEQYTLTTKVDLSIPTGKVTNDTNNVMVVLSMPTDTYRYNDTITKKIITKYKPPVPTVTDSSKLDINFGLPTTITVTQPASCTTHWWNFDQDPKVDTNTINKGNSYTTPKLSVSTYYNVRAKHTNGCYSDFQTIKVTVGNPPDYNAGIVTVIGNMTVCKTDAPVYKVVVRNSGKKNMGSVKINYTLGNNTYNPYTKTYTTPLVPDALDTITLPSISGMKPGAQILKIWVSEPDGKADGYALDDTLTRDFRVQFTGTITVAETGADYANLQEVLTQLHLAGVCSPVVVSLTDPLYTGTFYLDTVPNASATNTVTIQSKNNSMMSSGTEVADTCIIWVNGKYVIFDGITFNNSAKTEKSRMLSFENGVSDITIKRCTFRGIVPTEATLTLANAMVFFTGRASNVVIDSNNFIYGHYAVYLTGKDTAANASINNKIRYNTVDKTGAFIYLYGQKAPQILHNTGNTAGASRAAIHMTNIAGEFRVMSNYITTSNGIVFYSDYTKGTPGRGQIANNIFKSVNGTVVQIRGLNNADFSFNYLYGESSADAVSISNTAHWGFDFKFQNNVVSSGNGRVINIDATAAKPSVMSHNAYYYGTNATPFKNGVTNYVDYDKWNTAVKDTQSVALNMQPFNRAMEVDMDVYFVSLHTKGITVAGITTDYYDTIRPTPPTIGAVDFIKRQKDIAVDKFINPEDGGEKAEGSTDIVKVRMRNVGKQLITSGVVLKYWVNGVLRETTPAWSGTMVENQYIDYTFNVPYPVPVGPYTIKVEITYPGDEFLRNNEKTISVYGRPKHDAAIDSILEISSGCLKYQDTVTLFIRNNGSDPINSGDVIASYIDYNHDVVPTSQVVTLTKPILTDSVYIFKFQKPIATAAPTTGINLNFSVQAWVTMVNGEDANHANDSSKVIKFTSNYTPGSPDIISDTTITFATAVTLKVNTNANIQWYKSETASYPFWKGKSYRTSILKEDTVIYVAIENGCVGPRKKVTVRVDSPRNIDAAAIEITSGLILNGYVETPGIVLLVRNTGKQPMNTDNMKVYFQLGDVIKMGKPREENKTLYMAQDHEFTMQEIPVEAGWSNFKTWVEVANDEKHINDTINFQLYKNLLISALPYTEDFTTNKGWFTYGESLWEYGKPDKAHIDKAHSPNNAWVTGLTNNYVTGTISYLYSPQIDMLDDKQLEEISFWNIRHLDTGARAYVQYTDFNGDWKNLGTIDDVHGTNWYNTSQGYTTSTKGWEKATYNLRNLLLPVDVLQFRFVLNVSNIANIAEGWAIDDFTLIRALDSNDVGVTGITMNSTASIGDVLKPTVKIMNYGIVTQTEIPIGMSINGREVRVETWTGELKSNQSRDFTFEIGYATDTITHLALCVYTKLPEDNRKDNNRMCTPITMHRADCDLEAVKFLAPIDECEIGELNKIGILVKNVGTKVIYANSAYAYYQVGTIADNKHEPIPPVNLEPGESVEVWFKDSFIGMFGNQRMVAFVTHPQDNFRKNDTIKTLIRGKVNEEDVAPNGMVLEQNYPNPAYNSTTINYALPYAGTSRFIVVNTLGQIVYREEKKSDAGAYQIRLSKQQLPPGVYYYFLEFDKCRLTKKMIIR